MVKYLFASITFSFSQIVATPLSSLDLLQRGIPALEDSAKWWPWLGFFKNFDTSIAPPEHSNLLCPNLETKLQLF